MASYADLEKAQRELGLDPTNAAHADDLLMLQAIDEEISRVWDEKAGWTALAATRTFIPLYDRAGHLILPTPVRSVSAVAITGDAAETLAVGDWVLTTVTAGGVAYGLERLDGGGWPVDTRRSSVAITADWTDTVPTDVPAAVTDAVTFVTIETYRQRKTAPTGEIGPDGFTIRPRNPWAFEVVKQALTTYGARRTVAV